MKKDIHPKYFDKAEVTCACGAKFFVGSTSEKISVEICSACHPFYTGNDKVIDAAGRVERFKARAAKVGAKKVASKAKK
jgi:large subunit ribosomal protein L31